MNRSSIVRLLLFWLALIAPVQVSAQHHGKHSEATTSRVPELEEFHSVIFRVWHEAWPDKDYVLLSELLPEIEKGAASVAGAELPGILRDKQEAWDTGVAELLAVVEQYKQAAEGNQDEALLNAAEELHSQFEALARMIRPILPEIEDFHKSLYMLYHHYLPEYSMEKIRGSAKDLSEKMEALNDAALPGRYKKIAEDFDVARSTLAKSVQAFVTAVETEDKAEITAAVEQLHTDYRTLQTLCE